MKPQIQTKLSRLLTSLPAGVLAVGFAVFAPRAEAVTPGSLDPSFVPPADLQPVAVAVQPDGRILVAGGFTVAAVGLAGPVVYRGIIRLDPGGSLDTGFAPFDESVAAVAVQADGRILVGGAWATTNEVKRANICRLNTDGTLDASFDPGPGTDFDSPGTAGGAQPVIRHYVTDLRVQPDGRVLVNGTFTRLAGAPRPGLGRLNSDGSLDSSFVPHTGRNDSGFGRMVLQPDGRILAVGAYATASGGQVLHHLRLDAAGELDATFAPSRQAGLVVGSMEYPLEVQADGKILGPAFDPSGSSALKILRLQTDGSVDATFRATLTRAGDPNGINIPALHALRVTSNGRILIAGRFTAVNGQARAGIARLNPDGSLDPTFEAGASLGPVHESQVRAFAMIPDGRVLVAGSFRQIDGVACTGLGRIFGDPALRVVSLTRSGDGRLQATVESALAAGAAHHLESSSDLRQWAPVGRALLDGAVWTFEAPPGLEQGGFYRAAQGR